MCSPNCMSCQRTQCPSGLSTMMCEWVLHVGARACVCPSPFPYRYCLGRYWFMQPVLDWTPPKWYNRLQAHHVMTKKVMEHAAAQLWQMLRWLFGRRVFGLWFRGGCPCCPNVEGSQFDGFAWTRDRWFTRNKLRTLHSTPKRATI